MEKIKVAETFYSLQGEGKFVGVPSVFLRTFGCNFQCRGFGMPNGEKTNEPELIAEQFVKHPEWRYEELPLAKTGCDSYASWHPKFKSLSPMLDVDVAVKEIELARMSQHHQVIQDGGVHLVITGGEPLLGWQRAYPDLLAQVDVLGYKEITFETNGTQKIIDSFADWLLTQQITNSSALRFTFSVSPKLPCSGEKTEDALKPDVVASYQQFGDVYLKFVIAHMDDVIAAGHFIEAYKDAGFTGDVYLMPEGGTTDSYNLHARDVANIAMEYGFKFSPRLQVELWKNQWGT